MQWNCRVLGDSWNFSAVCLCDIQMYMHCMNSWPVCIFVYSNFYMKKKKQLKGFWSETNFFQLSLKRTFLPILKWRLNLFTLPTCYGLLSLQFLNWIIIVNDPVCRNVKHFLSIQYYILNYHFKWKIFIGE